MAGSSALGQRVLQAIQFEPQGGAGDGEVAFGSGDCGLIGHDLQGGNCLELELLLIVGQSLVGEAQRSLLDLLVLIGIDEIPVDIFDLGDGGDDLLLKDEVGDLGVLFGDADPALVGGEAESGEQGLGDLHRKIRIQIGIDRVVRRVAGDTLAEVIDLYVGAEGKGLVVSRQNLMVLCFENRHADQKLVGLLGIGVIDVALEGQRGIEGRDIGSFSQGGGDNAARASSRRKTPPPPPPPEEH